MKCVTYIVAGRADHLVLVQVQVLLPFLASLGQSIWEGFLERCEHARPYGILNQSDLSLALLLEVLESDLGDILRSSILLEAFHCSVNITRLDLLVIF